MVVWGETMVRRALRGDMQAAGIIADRIEGKAGTLRDDEDPEDQRRRGDMQAVIECVVTGLVNAKLNSADDSPEDFGLGSHDRRDRRRSAALTRRRLTRAPAADGRVLMKAQMSASGG